MSVNAIVSSDNKTVLLKISGRFDFSIHNDFRNAYKSVDFRNVEYVIDLVNTEYLDSSALGMLLLLKEYADETGSNVVINNANQEILEILKIASFDKLFTIN